MLFRSIFKTIYNFKLKCSINKYFSYACTVRATQNSNLTTDNTIIAGISTTKNNNDCEWDPMILTSYITHTSIFKFL